MKRDDLTGDMGLSGNKARKLEYLVGAAVAAGATHLLTTGGPQSNHARATAAAAARLGLQAVLILAGRDPGHREGNLLLDELFGAEVRFPGAVTPADQQRFLEEAAAELVADEESIVGTENAGIISLDVVASETDSPAAPDTSGPPRGRRSADEPNRTEKDTE